MVKREKDGKITPSANKKEIIIEIPDDYVIVIKPVRKSEEEVPTRPKVYKPHKEDIGTIYGRMAESIMFSNSNNADDSTDGFVIGR